MTKALWLAIFGIAMVHGIPSVAQDEEWENDEGDFSVEQTCAQLWADRNHVFDRAGQCFSSDLGASFFDNSDCTTNSPNLSENDVETVARIQNYERELNCNAIKPNFSLEFFAQNRVHPRNPDGTIREVR